MFDFFDEDFPLTKKQEEEYKKRLADEKEAEDKEKETPLTELVESVINGTVKKPVEDEQDITIEPIQNPYIYSVEEDAEAVEEVEETFTETADEVLEDVEETVAETADEVLEDVEETVAETADEVVETVEETVTETADEVVEDVEETVAETAKEVVEDVDETVAETADEVLEDVDETVAETAVEAVEAVNIAAEESVNVIVKVAESESVIEHEMPQAVEEAEVPNISEKIASLDEIEAHLHEELRSLGEKLDNMERVVDGMEDAEISEGFDYEYDERYFAEEETPAYRHPELYKKKAPEKKKAVPARKAKSSNIDTETIVKVGTVIAAAAVAVKLLGGKGKKK